MTTKPILNEKCEWRRINKWTFGLYGIESGYLYQTSPSREQRQISGESESSYSVGYSHACGYHD